MPGTPRPVTLTVFGDVPPMRDAEDFYSHIANVQSDGEHLALVTQFFKLTNGANLSKYVLYSVTADILPNLVEDRRIMFRQPEVLHQEVYPKNPIYSFSNKLYMEHGISGLGSLHARIRAWELQFFLNFLYFPLCHGVHHHSCRRAAYVAGEPT
jgi:hypothetical protein